MSLALHGHSLQISVRIAGARYPLSIDPIVQEGQLSGPSEGIGSSVAIEGSTIVVGAAGEIVSGGAKRDGQGEPQAERGDDQQKAPVLTTYRHPAAAADESEAETKPKKRKKAAA